MVLYDGKKEEWKFLRGKDPGINFDFHISQDITFLPKCVNDIRMKIFKLALDYPELSKDEKENLLNFLYGCSMKGTIFNRLNAIDYLILNLYAAWKLDVYLRYSRKEEYYVGIRDKLEKNGKNHDVVRRYNFACIRDFCNMLKKTHLAFYKDGYYNFKIFRGSRQSRIRVGTEIGKIFEKYDNELIGIVFDEGTKYERVIADMVSEKEKDLKIKTKGKRIIKKPLDSKEEINYNLDEINDTPEKKVGFLEKQMMEINDNNDYIDIHISSDNSSEHDIITLENMILRGKAERVGEKKDRNYRIPNIHMTRIFNDSDFSIGGRIYSDYQGLSKVCRSNMYLNDEKVASLDMKNSQVKMLYDEVNEEPLNSDIYTVDFDSIGIETKKGNKKWCKIYRKVVKKATLIMINAKNKYHAIWLSLQEAWKNKWDIKWKDMFNIINKIIEIHNPIKRFLNSGIGKKLQFYESEIMMNTILKARKLGISVLSMHDEIITQAKNIYLVGKIFKREYNKKFGRDCVLT